MFHDLLAMYLSWLKRLSPLRLQALVTLDALVPLKTLATPSMHALL